MNNHYIIVFSDKNANTQEVDFINEIESYINTKEKKAVVFPGTDFDIEKVKNNEKITTEIKNIKFGIVQNAKLVKIWIVNTDGNNNIDFILRSIISKRVKNSLLLIGRGVISTHEQIDEILTNSFEGFVSNDGTINSSLKKSNDIIAYRDNIYNLSSKELKYVSAFRLHKNENIKINKDTYKEMIERINSDFAFSYMFCFFCLNFHLSNDRFLYLFPDGKISGLSEIEFEQNTQSFLDIISDTQENDIEKLKDKFLK